jgi:hypothetical protein
MAISMQEQKTDVREEDWHASAARDRLIEESYPRRQGGDPCSDLRSGRTLRDEIPLFTDHHRDSWPPPAVAT